MGPEQKKALNELISKVLFIGQYIEAQKPSFREQNQTLSALYRELQQELETTDLNKSAQIYREVLLYVVKHYFSTLFMSPLMHATFYGRLDVMLDILQCCGGVVDEQFNHLQPARDFWGVRKLGQYHHYTALTFAVIKGNYPAAKLLLKYYANPGIEVEEQEFVSDFVDKEKYPELALLLENAHIDHINQLCFDLVDCKTKERLAYLMEMQKKLGISKDEVIEYLLEMHPDHPDRALEVLNQATDFDDYHAPQNSLAEYVQTPQGLVSIGLDNITIDKLQRRIKELSEIEPNTDKPSEIEPATEKPSEIKSNTDKPFLEIFFRGVTKKEYGPITTNYGPQNLVHPLTGEENTSEFLKLKVGDNKHF